jgi:hypothetical protein
MFTLCDEKTEDEEDKDERDRRSSRENSISNGDKPTEPPRMKAAVDLPEYMIPTSLLRELIATHGFELVLQENFQTFVGHYSHILRHRDLLSKMHVLNYQGSISDVEWDIMSLYQVVAFRKK